MATVLVQTTSTVAQARTVRAPPASGLMYTRPWRSSPLAGPVFSTLPPAIPESSEESYENELHQSAPAHPPADSASSSSIASQTGSLSASASGYASRNASTSASALALVDGDASASSASLAPSTGAQGTSSSHGHTSSQTYPTRSKRLSKPPGRRPSSAQGNFAAPKNASDAFMMPAPRPRTVSHGHSRPTSLPVQSLASSSPPTVEANNTKQSPSLSRDPSSNWMSSSPFGPAETPKFSRLAMASPTVIMPLSAREYRKQKARESIGKGTQKEPSTSSNRVTFIDNAVSAIQSPNGVPVVKVSPPPSEDVHWAPSSSGDHSSDRRSQSQPQVDHPPSQPLPQASMSPRPSSPKQKRPRSRPNTPPRSSPLAAHPPISPKSSAGTFFSVASSSSDDENGGTDTVPPARPRPRLRRKSYPDRLSNGVRLSLVEAMNRLSHEGASLHRLSAISQTNGVNRLSVASEASGHTLFYDVVEPDVAQGQVTAGKGNGHVDHGSQRTSVLHTQSLEDLSSTLARTGIEVVDGRLGGLPAGDDGRKGKRNVRTVRISDRVEVSPPPVPRRRKLTKSRPEPARRSMQVSGAAPAPGPGTVRVKTQTQTPTQDRLVSLLPWKSKGSSYGKSAGAGVAAAVGEGNVSTATKVLVQSSVVTISAPVTDSVPPTSNGSAHVEGHSKPTANGSAEKIPSDRPPTFPGPGLDPAPSTPPRKSRRYTFSFLPSPAFHRPKREKSNTAPPASVDLGLDRRSPSKSKGSVKGSESGTDSTSTSIRTITQGSQSTLVPTTYDLTTPASSGMLSGSGRGSRSSVPMLRRVTAQEIAASASSQGAWEGTLRGDYSTPSLITNGSTTTTGSSSPRTPSGVRLGEPFVPRPSGLKASYTDTFEEDSEGSPGGGGRTSRLSMHRKHESSPLARGGAGWGEMSEEDERHLRPAAGARPGSRPGTASSTATETSGSYLSFSTVPASTTSSSSMSRSPSPAPVVGDRRNGDGDEVVHACAMCGHRLPPMRSTDEVEMHPMFTVPLVTVPAPQMRGGNDAGARVPRYARKHRSERYTSESVLGAANVLPARYDPRPNHTSVVYANGPVTPTKTRTMAIYDEMSPSLSPSPARVRKQRRPQTAPVGTGDASLRFIEEVDVLVGADRAMKLHKDKDKAGSGESRFKTALKGLLRWAS